VPTTLVDEGPVAAGTSSGLTIPLPPALNGDFVYAHVMLYSPNSVSNVDLPAADRPVTVMCQSSVSETGVVKGWNVLLGWVFDPDDYDPGDILVTLSWPTNAITSGSVYVGRTYVVRDADGAPSDLLCAEAGPYTTANQPTAALALPEGSDLVVQLIVSVGSSASGNPPTNYVAGTRVSTDVGAQAWFLAWHLPDPSVTTEPAHTTAIAAPASGAYWIVAIGFSPRASIFVPAVPEPQRLSLDCADTYNVLITAADYATVVHSVGWSSIEWSRVLDEVSTATVVIPDRLGGVYCCADAGGLLPWRYGLMIERNDEEVWSGPVTALARQGESLRVTASDVMARFQKRLVSREDLDFTNMDSGAVFARLINAAQFSSDIWGFAAPVGLTATALTRTVKAVDFEMSFDVLSDLANSSVDFFVMAGDLYVFDVFRGWVHTVGLDTATLLAGPYLSTHEFLYGMFTEDCWAQRPDWSINGMEQGNAVWVAGPDTGEEGSRRFWVAQDLTSQTFDGVLDLVDDNPLYQPAENEIIPDAVFQLGADSTLALRKIAPAVIEGGALAVGAPVDISNLRPGSLWLCDIHDACYGQLLQIARLKRVQVTVSVNESGITESIAPTLTPPGARE
jgi:hypothetical protein